MKRGQYTLTLGNRHFSSNASGYLKLESSNELKWFFISGIRDLKGIWSNGDCNLRYNGKLNLENKKGILI